MKAFQVVIFGHLGPSRSSQELFLNSCINHYLLNSSLSSLSDIVDAMKDKVEGVKESSVLTPSKATFGSKQFKHNCIFTLRLFPSSLSHAIDQCSKRGCYKHITNRIPIELITYIFQPTITDISITAKRLIEEPCLTEDEIFKTTKKKAGCLDLRPVRNGAAVLISKAVHFGTNDHCILLYKYAHFVHRFSHERRLMICCQSISFIADQSCLTLSSSRGQVPSSAISCNLASSCNS